MMTKFKNFVGRLRGFVRPVPVPADENYDGFTIEEIETEVPTAVATDVIDSGCESDCEEPEPWLYRAKKLLPGAPANKKLFGSFFFLVLGRYLPVLDFLSDLGSAGISYK